MDAWSFWNCGGFGRNEKKSNQHNHQVQSSNSTNKNAAAAAADARPPPSLSCFLQYMLETSSLLPFSQQRQADIGARAVISSAKPCFNKGHCSLFLRFMVYK